MRKLGWYAVSALVAGMILGSVLLLAANLYVQSPTVQQRIRQALAATLHMPVTIRKITLSPWEGLRIDGLTAQPVGVGTPGRPPDGLEPESEFLKADSFRVHFALWPLLHKRFVVTLLWLDKPQLAWAQEADGRWQFPPGATETRHHRKLRSWRQGGIIWRGDGGSRFRGTAGYCDGSACGCSSAGGVWRTPGPSARRFRGGRGEVSTPPRQPRFSQRQASPYRSVRGG